MLLSNSCGCYLLMSFVGSYFVALGRTEEDHVYPNAIDAEPIIPHVLSREGSDGSWECRLSECSFSHEFTTSKVPVWGGWRWLLRLVSTFGFTGITRVFFGSDFVTVTKSEDASWDIMKPEIFAAIMDFYSSGNPLFLDSNTAASMDTAIHEFRCMNTLNTSYESLWKPLVACLWALLGESLNCSRGVMLLWHCLHASVPEMCTIQWYAVVPLNDDLLYLLLQDDSETVAMIKELLETRIRPAVQDDGGDIEYRTFDPDTGIVKLRMQGACSGCPSSSVTLKSGIENMLMHYVPEVKGVEEELDDEDEEAILPA
ncbi:hypothetical protein C3L33_16826, partial [Rhododendron williamsianum]